MPSAYAPRYDVLDVALPRQFLDVIPRGIKSFRIDLKVQVKDRALQEFLED